MPELRIVDAEDEHVASLAPLQGLWTVEQYLKLTDHSRRLLEYADGTIEVLPLPIPEHQKILALLYELFVAFVRPRGGIVLFAPFAGAGAATEIPRVRSGGSARCE